MQLYRYAIANREECGVFSVLKAFHTLLKIWNHPGVLAMSAKSHNTHDLTAPGPGARLALELLPTSV
jgi:hypothetical protein